MTGGKDLRRSRWKRMVDPGTFRGWPRPWPDAVAPVVRLIFWTAGLLWLSGGSARAQDGFFDRYRARFAAVQGEQPHWAAPLTTVAPILEQGFRSDFVRQSLTGGQQSWSYGDAKGLQFVPFRRTELRLSPPTFLTHTNPKQEDGFGDVGFRLKYRFYGSSEEHRNAVVSAFVGATVPTGKNGNGSCCATVSPTLELGKGAGRVALTTSAGGSLPVTNATKLGRQIVWNTAVQYHVQRYLWPQMEVNTTFFKGGRNDGKGQAFLTPGLIVSRLPLIRGSNGGRDVLALTLGAGEQIAVTHASTYNHAPIFTARLRF